MGSKKLILILIIFVTCASYISTVFATEESNAITFDNTVRMHPMEAIAVPERDINLKIENLTVGCRVYLYIPTELIKYNLEKFMNNNLGNDFLIEDWEANDLKEFLEKEDYIGYIEYLKQFGFKKESNEIELRHYSFCLDSVELLDYVEYDGNRYVSFKIFPNEEHEFKIVMKDYLATYDSRNIKFMIDEYGTKTYIDLTNEVFTSNVENTSISELNIDYHYESQLDQEEINRILKIAYTIIFIILLIIVLIILFKLFRRHMRKKKELEERKFWKKEPEESKEEKKRKKLEQKEILKHIKSKKRKKK